MNATVARLTARSLLGRRRALIMLALPATLLLLAGVTRWLGGPDDKLAVALLDAFALGTVVPLFALIAGTGAIGPEIDDGSIVYLLSKPLSRPSIVHTKLAVAAVTVVVAGAGSTLLAGLLLAGTSNGIAVGYAVAAAVAGVIYCALFLLLAVLTRNAVVIGLLYALIWESVIGGYVPGAQVLSVRQWSLALTKKIVGAGAADLGVTAAVGLTTSVVLLIVLLVGCIWYAGQRLRTLRLTGDQ
jgi:ABC-2 type transport system permease protein